MPGLNLCTFFTPLSVTLAVLRAALFASYLRGALDPVFLRAVYFVRAIRDTYFFYY